MPKTKTNPRTTDLPPLKDWTRDLRSGTYSIDLGDVSYDIIDHDLHPTWPTGCDGCHSIRERTARRGAMYVTADGDTQVEPVNYATIQQAWKALTKRHRLMSQCNPRRRNADDDEDDEDEVELSDDPRYDDTKEAIEQYVERHANIDAASQTSYVDDETQIQIERKGYDPESIVSVAYFGNEESVNGDVLVSPFWEQALGIKKDVKHPVVWGDASFETSLSAWLKANGYENTDRGGAWPGGVNIEIDVDQMAAHLAGTQGDRAFIRKVVEDLADGNYLSTSKDYKTIYTGSSNGRIAIYAQPVATSNPRRGKKSTAVAAENETCRNPARRSTTMATRRSNPKKYDYIVYKDEVSVADGTISAANIGDATHAAWNKHVKGALRAIDGSPGFYRGVGHGAVSDTRVEVRPHSKPRRRNNDDDDVELSKRRGKKRTAKRKPGKRANNPHERQLAARLAQG